MTKQPIISFENAFFLLIHQQKKYISRVKLVDGTTAEIKDQEARLMVDSLFTDTIILYCGTSAEVLDCPTE